MAQIVVERPAAPASMAAREDRDGRSERQDTISARGPVRQIRRLPRRPRRVRPRRQRGDGDLDLLPRHKDAADRRAGGQGPGSRQADRAVDLRARSPDQLGDAGEPGHAGEAPRRLCPAAAPGLRRQPAVPAQRRRPRGVARLQAIDHDRRQRRPLPRHALHRRRRPRRQLCAGLVRRPDAADVDLGGAFRLQRRRHRGRDRSQLPLRLPVGRPGRQGGLCLCRRSTRARAGDVLERARNRQGPLQAAAGCGRDRARPRARHVRHRLQWPCGDERREHRAEARLERAVRAADDAGLDADPRPAGAHRAADRHGPDGRDPGRYAAGAPHDHPYHGAARRRAQARRRRFQPPHRRAHLRRAGGPRRAVQPHGRPDPGDLFAPGDQGRGAHPRSRAVDPRAQGAGGGRPRGGLLARSQRGACDHRGPCDRDHPCRRGADLRLRRRGGPLQPGRGQRHRQIRRRRACHHRAGREHPERCRRQRRADRACRARRCRGAAAARGRARGRLQLGAGGAADRPAGHAGLAGGAAPRRRASSPAA
ncbi:hypothetical protein ABIF91_003054 [Bradyrhizobium sp. USDA 241]